MHFLIKLANKLRGATPGHDQIIEEEDIFSRDLSEPQGLEVIDTNQSDEELDELLLGKSSKLVEEVKKEIKK